MNEVIHLAANAVFSANTYTAVYCSAAGTPTINGVAVPMVAGSSIIILVKTISATAGIYVIGRQRLIAPSVING
jgi:hypothetical protein